jgi:hypothetical protein
MPVGSAMVRWNYRVLSKEHNHLLQKKVRGNESLCSEGSREWTRGGGGRGGESRATRF